MSNTNDSKKETKPFVGFCRFSIVDIDGISKKTNGCFIQVPLHQVNGSSNDEDTITFEAELPPTDPVRLLRLHSDNHEMLTGFWYYGSPVKENEGVAQHTIFAVLESCPSGVKLDEAYAANGEFKGIAHCPLIPQAYSHPFDVSFFTKQQKMKTRITKVILTMQKSAYSQFMEYYTIVKELDDKKDKNEKNSDKEKKDDELLPKDE